MSIRADILSEATRAVTQDRAATHGRPEDTFGLLARLWADYLGVPVSATDAALMLALLKIARARGNPAHRDNFVDLAGYAACAGELAAAAAPVASAPTPVPYWCNSPMPVTTGRGTLRCVSEGCDNLAAVHFVRGGVGADYCAECYLASHRAGSA